MSSRWADPAAASAWDAAADDSPGRAEQLELLLAVLERFAPRSVLELGVGSGLVAEALLERLPDARFVGIDGSEAMLELARARLERFGDRVRLELLDLAEPETLAIEPPEAVVSVQVLHHLDDVAKRRVWARVAKLVRPGALVLLRDKVTVPEALFDAYAAVWETRGEAMPATVEALAAELAAKGDRPAALVDQLGWLDEAGFDAAPLDVHAHYALVAAVRREA